MSALSRIIEPHAPPARPAQPVAGGAMVSARTLVSARTARTAAMERMAQRLADSVAADVEARLADDAALGAVADEPSEDGNSEHPARPQAFAPGALEVDPELIRQTLESARQEGYTQGYAEGAMRAETELDAAVLAAGELAGRLDDVAPGGSLRFAAAVAELGLSVARHLIGEAVAHDPAVLAEAIAAAIDHVGAAPTVRVFLHPAASGSVQRAWEQRFGGAYLGKTWTFEPDPALPATGCYLRYEHGIVDAGMETALEEVGRTLHRHIETTFNLTSGDGEGGA